MSLSEYVSNLPQQRRALLARLTSHSAELARGRPDISPFVFVHGMPHPEWEDSEEVLWLAMEQMMFTAETPQVDGELPVLWIGYHIMNRFGGKREAQGLLLTDRRLIVKDSFDLVFSKGTTRSYPLRVRPEGIDATAIEIAGTALGGYAWENTQTLIEPEHIGEFTHLLTETIRMTLDETGATVPDAASQAAAMQAVRRLRDRVTELSLHDEVKYPDEPKHRKHFERLAKVIPLDDGERILAAFSDRTILGVYGLLLTDRNLRSRDLAEAAVATDRSDVGTVQVSSTNKTAMIDATGVEHSFPAHLNSEQISSLISLVQEWAERRVD